MAASAQAANSAMVLGPQLVLPAVESPVKLPDTPAIDDPKATLAPFYARVGAMLRAGTKLPGGPVRIGMYGDSNMTMDTVSGGLRRQLQAKFGDAGHGFVAAGRPWAWYRHMDVRQDLSMDLWTHFVTSTKPTSDHHYGMSHIAAESLSPGASVSIETAKPDAPIGKTVSSIDVYYLERPKSGSFALSVDGKDMQEVDTSGDSVTAGVLHLDVPDAPHRVTARVTKGHVRLLGFTFERGTAGAAGFVVDSFGIGSMNYDQFNRVSEATRDPMLKRRDYGLITFLIGTNVWATEAELTTQITNVIKWYRAALPNVPLLFMSTPDAASPPSPTHSDKRLGKLNTMIREIATQNGAAFWDFREAMGGEMSIARFAKAHLAEYDYVHFKEAGGAIMGASFGQALFAGLREYEKMHPLSNP
jgi:GDSL-like Lipase/Acylhydrolase family